MTSLSYYSAASVYSLTIFLAIALFGPHSASFALNNFSPKDPIAVMAFLAFGTSVLASFPLIFLNMRNFFIKQAQHFNLPAIASVKRMTAVLLTLIGAVASICTDIGKVGAVAGAIFGSSMMFIFPPIMYLGALRKEAEKSKHRPSRGLVLLNIALLCAGLGVGSMGAINSLKALFART
jgi:hypothetical protein